MTAKVRVHYKLWPELLDLFVVSRVSHVHILFWEAFSVQEELLYCLSCSPQSSCINRIEQATCSTQDNAVTGLRRRTRHNRVQCCCEPPGWGERTRILWLAVPCFVAS